MNIKNISEKTLEKIKEYNYCQTRANNLFEELQTELAQILSDNSININGLDVNDVYIEGIVIEDEPFGVRRKNGTYIRETKVGEDAGWGHLSIPLDNGKYLGIDYEY